MRDQRYKLWAVDYDSPYEAQYHAIETVLLSSTTKYQKMDIVKTAGYGKALMLDGRIQSSERDEYIYHESLVHPSAICGPSPEKVIIIGGGEGATLREVLRYDSVSRAVLVDIDEEVIQACREHLPEFHRGAFDDSRVEVVIGDGREYIKQCSEKFDVMIIDISEPTEGGPAYLLYTTEFYELVGKALNRGGRVVTQACSSSIRVIDNFTMICRTMEKAFGSVHPYHSYVPSFGTTWGFALWAEGLEEGWFLDLEVDRCLEDRRVGSLEFYDTLTNRAIFTLPRDIRMALAGEKRILSDDNPPLIY